ncbi:hypothetical protein PVL29_020474 [Vitis rotundifolia]|uniref:Cytochrome P450 n=1 Tax=Vitis rotundifolia TaxID=103349 RepID=A0AA38YXB0_VITRO|nr:hypothetical protein PVL29_020474 [Vitis rotundifolia]
MEMWLFILIFICVATPLKYFYGILVPKLRLPPGPITLPLLVINFLWLRKSFSDFESILRNLHAKYGPIITLQFGSRPAIYVSSNSLAHQALIQNSAVFADRPPLPTNIVMSCNQYSISSASYGPRWRLLRHNLTAEILHPSRVKSYSQSRKWVLEILISRLQGCLESGESVRVVDHFQYAMFCLLVLMCFGDKLEESQIQEIETTYRRLFCSFVRFSILNFWPRVGKILFRRRWEEFQELLKEQEEILIPHIRARQQLKSSSSSKDSVLCYVDTLLDLQLSEEKRKLNDGEIVSLCSEFFIGGTDTTSSVLQWIMANLVKYPRIQARLFKEISGVVGAGEEEVKEEDLRKMPYLKAVVLEGLRRHPPGHFLLPHAVTQDITLDGYVIPKNATVNFMVAEIGWDPKVWKDPMEFKPERFLNEEGDWSREIKMMPFGAGRRTCPGHGLAMLHLEYFVANLVWSFEWKAVEGDEVDLSEKQEFTIVMKNPLQAHLSPRLN